MGERIFRTTESLKNELSDEIKIAHKITVDRLMDELHRIEEEEVYNKPALFYTNSNWKSSAFNSGGYALYEYDRTYDLYDVIGVSKIGTNQYQTVAEIKPILGTLTHDWMEYQHDNPYSYPIDEEMYLNIIEGGIEPKKSMFGRIMPRPFFDEFLKYCDENYDKIFAEEMDKL